MAINGRRLTPTQVFEWNEAWSNTDRAKITVALDAVPDRMCVIPLSGGYIGVWIDGEEANRALIIYPGYLVWPGGRWTKDLPPELFPEMECDEGAEWHLLSTFRPHTGRTSKREASRGGLPELFHGATTDGRVRQLRLTCTDYSWTHR